jgi:hypothetical protein
MFQSNTLFTSVAELKAFYLANNLDIFDEYDNVYSWEQFTERVLEYADELTLARSIQNRQPADHYVGFKS